VDEERSCAYGEETGVSAKRGNLNDCLSKHPGHSTDFFFFLWRCDPTRVLASSFTRFLDHTQRRNTVGSTPLDEWSARRRDLYLTTHNTHNRQISMPPLGFEPTISAGERPQFYALAREATGTGSQHRYSCKTIVMHTT